MKFLCLGYLDSGKMDALPPAQVQAVLAECPPHLAEFHATGKVLLVAGTGSEAGSLQRVDGRLQRTTRRSGEDRTEIGCVFLVEAADLDEAVRIAALHPTTRIAAGERLGFRIGIHPVQSLEPRDLAR